jgi:hypothetical protein
MYQLQYGQIPCVEALLDFFNHCDFFFIPNGGFEELLFFDFGGAGCFLNRKSINS